MTRSAELRWVAGALLLAAGLAMLAVGVTAVSSAEQTVVRLVPSSQNASVGGSVSVDVEVENVRNLAAFDFGIAYDPDVLAFDSAWESPFLGSSGRAVTCYTPEPGDEDMVFACVTAKSEEPPGVYGSGVLATVRFAAVGSGTSPLIFTKIGLTDWDSCDSWGINDDGDDCFNEDPVDGHDNDGDELVDEDPPDPGLLVLQEAAVGVVGSGEPTPSSLPPTPTPNPAALTPTPIAGAPTPGADYTLPSQGPGAPGTEGQQPSGRSTGGATGTSPTGGAAGTDEDFPGAGTGPPPESTSWTTAAGAGLAASGLLLLWGGALYQRLRHRSSRTDR